MIEKMTIEKAREIMRTSVLHQPYVVEKAKGFIEGSDYERKRAEKLVEVLEFLSGSDHAPHGRIAKEALSQYRKEETK